MTDLRLRGKAWKRAVARALVLYATGADGYDAHMDAMCHRATEKQWTELCALLHFTDTVMAEAGVGSVAQLEEYLAQEERRESRFPALLFVGDDAERERRILALEREFTRQGQDFRPYTYRHIHPEEEPDRPVVAGDRFGFEYNKRRLADARDARTAGSTGG